MSLIIFIADGWGPSYGGINSFNYDICRAMPNIIGKNVNIICLLKDVDAVEVQAASVLGLELLLVGNINFESAEYIASKVKDKYSEKDIWWIGHDVKTGLLANQCAAITESKSAVIIHMDYEAYHNHMDGNGENTRNKHLDQKKLISGADKIFAVGPKLHDAAEDILKKIDQSEDKKVTQLLPGIADIKPILEPLKKFSAITFGRFSKDNDIIKQGILAVASFSSACSNTLTILGHDPTLYMIGIDSEDKLAKQDELSRYSQYYADRTVNNIGLEYTENRKELFDILRESSICMMLSLHEGFGLVGFEAIAAGVPLIISENSGLYSFLKNELKGIGEGSVYHINIRGKKGSEPHPDDLNNVSKAILEIKQDYQGWKKKAILLRDEIVKGNFTWENTARTLIQSLGLRSCEKANEAVNTINITNTTKNSCEFEIQSVQLDIKEESIKIPDVMDLTHICNSFPDVCGASKYESGKVIERENIINTIDTIFSGETQIIGIEGEEGIGKTYLLAQMANTHPLHTISVFIKPNNRWGYDPAVIRYDLCNQLNWLFTGQQIDEPQLADESLLQQLILKLHKRARMKSEFYYFLVDGLDELPEEGRQTKQIILDMLPLGYPKFRFIFSGDPEKILIKKNGLTIKSYPLAGFIYDETRRYFEGFNINSQCLQEIHRTFKGIPGRLATVRRIFESQTDIDCEAFVKDMPVKLSELFEIEWANIDEENEKQLLLIGIVAFERKAHSVTSIGAVMGLPVQEILKLLQGMKFINVEAQEVAFVSEAFRRFVAEKLFYLKSNIHNLLINHLYTDPECEEALAYLPGYLEQAGRLDDLIDYLSPEHFEEMLHRTQSLSIVEQKADLGLNTALKLKRDGELMRFSIQKATIRELDGAQIWRSEIEARMALKQYAEALALAQTTILKEDKLHLLAVVARRMREQESGIEPELIEQIKQIYKEIDYQSLGSRSVQIASDLIYVLPELAVELVEKANSVASDEINDLAFATLSIANHNSLNELENREETMRNLDSRIKNPHVRQFSLGVALLGGKYSALQVIDEVQKFGNISEQLFLLRQWAKSNSQLVDAYKVVEYALKVTIRTTTYAPNARIFRELATPLPFITNLDIARELVGNFDSQKAEIEHLGLTEDYIRLLLTLAETEGKYDRCASASRLTEAYLYTTYIEDLAIKTACMARVVATLENIHNEVLNKTDNLKILAEEDLRSDVSILLLSTANHFGVTELVLRALARTKHEMALEFARMLNTQERRNLALKEVLINYLRNEVDVIEFSFVDKVLKEITDTRIKDLIILKAIERLESLERVSNEIMELSMPILDKIDLIGDPSDSCEACTLALTCLGRRESPEDKPFQEKLLQVLNNSWTDIDRGWHRVNIGYKIAASLSKNFLDNAMMYLKLTDEYRKKLLLDSETATSTYMGCISLSIRAYSGLLPKNKETLEDYQRLTNLINRIPSNGERTLLWSELALRCYLKNRPDLGGRIVTEHIRPLLQNIPEKDYLYKRQLTRYVAPTLYKAHKLTAFDLIEKLPFADKDKAYANICSVILTKVPLGDPYDGKEYKGLTYEEITDICEILNKMISDSNIFYFIGCITDTMSKRKAVYSEQQKSDIARRIGEIIEKKFPDPNNIQHDGYKIASEAVIQSLIKSGSKPWLQLIIRAKEIPNLADRAFILGVIAEAMPSKEVILRLTTLNEAKEFVDKIPATLDRIDHYEMLASFASNFDVAWAKQIIQQAVRASVTSRSPELHQVQKDLINLAYRIDPEMASSLATLVDDDESRKDERSNLKREIMLQELRASMTENKKLENGEINLKDCAKAAQMVLGSLNARRVTAIHIENTREFFKIASSGTFGQSFSIMSWVIENLTVRYSKTDHVTQFLRPAFEATALGAELAGRMAERASKIQQNKANFTSTFKNDNFIVQPNNREEAIQHIKDWFETDVRDYVKICDPYFGLDDLEVLQIISSVNPACKVEILTSVKHQTDEEVREPYKDTYRNHWRLKISDQAPPDTDIVIVGLGTNGKTPIHDRCWLTNGSGLRVGTSFNSLGNKLPEISIISKDEAKSLEDEVDRYLERKIREYKDERLNYEIFSLA